MSGQFISYAQNAEDVVLWRTFRGVVGGRYVDAGSIAKVFADAGWTGLDLEPGQAARLDDLLDQQGWSDEPLHFVSLGDAAAEVVAGLDLRRWRPWVLVVASDEPEADVLAAGYRFCLFDGVSRFYVAEEHAAELGPRLSYPACVLDDYTTASRVAESAEREELLRQVIHWRSTAFGSWSRAVEDTRRRAVQQTYLRQSRDKVKELRQRVQRLRGELDEARARLDGMEGSTSWRVTRPLRGATGSARKLTRRGR